MSVTIIVNGKKEKVNRKLTVDKFLKNKDIRTDAVVVKLNNKMINKKNYQSLQLKEGDKLEYLYYMGGGR